MNGRVIAASKVDLEELVGGGIFRPDLFYRINMIPIEISPPREKVEDVPLLLACCLQVGSRRAKQPPHHHHQIDSLRLMYENADKVKDFC